MADSIKPDVPARADSPRSANGTATAPPPSQQSAAARIRMANNQPGVRDLSDSRSPKPQPSARRRSSVISYSSIEDVAQAFTDDFILPRTTDKRARSEETDFTHWHSAPLAFAILPAIAGVLFHNGSLFVTDVLLLGLAALFLNWSIRVPWDWYFSAQALRRDVEPVLEIDPDDTIVEEAEDDVAVDAVSSFGGSPRPMSRGRKMGVGEPPATQNIGKREEAAASLRRQETFALVATFLAPVAAAYLLHYIRSQLRGPSTSLVSDYNLSIFLLAAEIRPTRQVMRLLSSRTLHLQRTVAGVEDPFSSALQEKGTVTSLAARISEMESKLEAHTIAPPTVSLAQKADVSDLAAELRKRYEPRLDGLERAVRRYEKRFTTLALATDQRIAMLETRLQEAVSLAAVAAQNSQSRGLASEMFDTIIIAVTAPLRLAWKLFNLPFSLVEDLYAKFKTLMLGPAPSRSSKRKSAKYDGSGREEKGIGKIMRKVVR